MTDLLAPAAGLLAIGPVCPLVRARLRPSTRWNRRRRPARRPSPLTSTSWNLGPARCRLG